MNKTIIERMFDTSCAEPDKVAVITHDQEICYCELVGMVKGYCLFLRSIGVKKGDKIVVKASQTIDYVVAYFAIHLSGAIVVSVEHNSPEAMLYDIADKMNAKVIISKNLSYSDMIMENHSILDCARKNYYDICDIVFPDMTSIADIIFTTGTTGRSKGVMLTHKALVATAENLVCGCNYTSNTIIIVPGPLNHSNAIRKLQVSMYCGGGIYLLNGMLGVERFFQALKYPKGKKACCLPPAMVRKILQMTGDRIGDFSDVIDFIESASSPLPEVDKEKLCSLLPHTRLYNNYGSTESASVCMFDYNQFKGMKNCIGKALPNSKIFIVDENRNIINSSYERVGLIACEGAVNMLGYYNDEEATKEVMDAGIVYSKDIGYMDEEGFVYILGRKDDVINVGGFKVSPVEVENIALKFKGVEECVCLGADHDTYGKVIRLLYVEDECDKVDVKQLNRFMLASVASYMVPQIYERVSEIKKTYNGKIDRKAYRE